ncbi:7923_t:CDS:1 [Entrophospora sp. SA101]|nr:1068_t:CDS:1 [Entrophospora sp. SA101]CAJ0829063.1 7923_t:CDS:1 [Entrophospora sp. SA101]CAJ0919081.1 476_t:CDS:1 [Entrophospora sp. SA101]
MEVLKKLLSRTNVNYIQLIDREADDLIASFIQQSTKERPEINFAIFTRDKDLLQLLSENTDILKYINNKITLYTSHHFSQEYNFLPKNYVDYLSLLGDKADNVAGVKGIGPVSAKNLIQQFQTVENIYQKLENLPENIKKLLENKQELVFRNKKIIKLEENISLPSELYKNCDFGWEKWKNNEELQKFCLDNKFNSILKLLID